MIEFTVYGQAVPQGSKRHVGHGIMVESSKGLGAWRTDVRAAAARYVEIKDQKPLEGPLAMSVTFYRLRPKSAPKKRTHPDTRPDSSKLLRAVEDACEGILYLNDAQFCDTRVRKEFGDQACAVIAIWEIK